MSADGRRGNTETLLSRRAGSLSPYIPSVEGAGEACTDLSDNTNLFFGPLEDLDTLGGERIAGQIKRYPSYDSRPLREELGSFYGLDPGTFVCGNGSDELLDLCVKAFCDPGDPVAFCPPTFGMYGWFARANGCRAEAIPLSEGFLPDIDALARSEAKLLYLCTPNNPTGNALDEATIESVIERFPGVVVLDEAYMEFSDTPGFIGRHSHDRLLVLRTFSKAWGLAGIRTGYGCGPIPLIEAIKRAKPPYNLNSISEGLAIRALGEKDHISRIKRQVFECRTALEDGLRELGMTVHPSDANFILVDLPEDIAFDARGFSERLRDSGYLVRYLGPSLDRSVRITVPPMDIVDGLLAAARDIICRE